jgi:hypothetical protein
MSESPAATSSSRTPLSGRRWWHVLMAAIVFLGGGACGAAVASAVILHSLHGAIHDPHQAVRHFTDRLTRTLDLNESQVEQVRQVIMRRHEALAELHREIQPRLDVELTALEEEIAAVLDEAQRVKWHDHVREFRKKWLPRLPDRKSAE